MLVYVSLLIVKFYFSFGLTGIDGVSKGMILNLFRVNLVLRLFRKN